MEHTSIRNRIKQILKLCAPPIALAAYRRARRRRNADIPARRFDLPVATLDTLFPGIWPTSIMMNEATLDADGMMALPLRELLVVAAICKYSHPRKIFEFGTFTGLSTLMMAMNTEEETWLYTLDIDPSSLDTHEHGTGVGGFTPFEVGACFQNTPYKAKITQLFGNSLALDCSQFKHSIDIVFVDADHSYRFAMADTEKAFELVSSGGIIIWDDYIWSEDHPECSGVARTLHEFQNERQIYQITGTRLAVYLSKMWG